MRHYMMNTNDNRVQYYLDQYVDEKTGHDVWQLSYSNCSHWTDEVRENNILKVINDGNGFQIKWEEKPKKNYLDYSQMRELQLVLTFIQTYDPVDHEMMALLNNDKLRF